MTNSPLLADRGAVGDGLDGEGEVEVEVGATAAASATGSPTGNGQHYYGSIQDDDDDDYHDPASSPPSRRSLIQLPHVDLSSIKPVSAVSRRVSSSLEYLVETVRENGRRSVSVVDVGGTASVAEEVFNLTKNVVGTSMLAIPGGIAAYGDAPSALIPAIILILLLAVINAYYFSVIGRVCAMTGAVTYRQAWERSVGHGWGGPQIVAWVCTLKAGFGNLAGSMILADSVRRMLLSFGGINHCTRTGALVLVTALVLWPLCLLKHLRVLAPFSLLGVSAVGLTVAVIVARCIDGTYSLERAAVVVADGGGGGGRTYLPDLPEELRPEFGDAGAYAFFERPRSSLLLVGMLATAYVAHYNAPRFYVELKHNTIPRYNKVIGISYTIGALVYVAVATAGFLTFGGNSAGFVLANYSPKDLLANTCRVAIDASIALSYPLVFVGCRDGVLDILGIPPEKQTVRNLNILSTVLLIIITALAAHFRDLDLVLSFGGATLATAVIYVFPTLMFRAAVDKVGAELGDGILLDRVVAKDRTEVVYSMGLMCVGIVLGCLGALIALGIV